MNQTLQWKKIGIKNIQNLLSYMNKKLNYKLHEENSIIAIPKLKKKYDIAFIDGSHDEKIVILDIINCDNKLIINGLMIIDDVLHKGVKNAIFRFIKEYKNYKRISISNSYDFIEEKILYNPKSEKKSFLNPNTMYCFQKIGYKN
jgi:predicted O-methyltransferase YrrM